MARVCSICGKKPVVGHNVSHANNKTKKLWKPNLQRIRVTEGHRTKRKNVCTRCIRSGRIEKSA